MRKLGASRREFFETIDRPALMPLPVEPYQYAEWRRARVAPDYHVEVQGHFYSVPSRLIRQVVEVRSTQTTVEVFHRGARIIGHVRTITSPQNRSFERRPLMRGWQHSMKTPPFDAALALLQEAGLLVALDKIDGKSGGGQRFEMAASVYAAA